MTWDRERWSRSFDPREAELKTFFGQPLSPDDIVRQVESSFASDLARILDQGGRTSPGQLPIRRDQSRG